jgi:regulator of nonsense transcripts 1
LLEAEQAEAERQFNERLKNWSDAQLMREGFMLDRLGGDAAWQPKFKVEGRVVTFAKIGRAATRPLPAHQFEPGTTVLLSRTDPLVDPAVNPDLDEPLKGSVLSHARGNVRVIFPFVPPDIAEGLWRIDVGCSDFGMQRQKQALERLNVDPVKQDMAQFAGRADEDAESVPPPPPPKPKQTTVQEALLATRRKKDTEQMALAGTALRDLLLRRFQADYAPPLAGPAGITTGEPTESAESVNPASFADAADMKPTDVDAVASVTVPEQTAPGILGRNQLIASWTKRYRQPEGREIVAVEGDPVVPLNSSQVRAIALMLSERLSLVQGVSSGFGQKD